MRIKINLNDQIEEIEVVRQGDRLFVTRGDLTTEATIIHKDGAHFVLEVVEEGPGSFIKRKRIRAAGYRDGDKRQLWANGRLISYKRIRDGSPSEAQGAIPTLSATIPAVVSEILVETGQEVTQGMKLLLLESMKMIMPIQSPCDGRVTAINCSVGEAVQPGVQLIDVEPAV
ncbi:MAG: acetyl-CoA carboxylase biotin carboxyl carrier protein subunit [Candidatus Promineifilaceae bacterium]|jgi:biotin carboxyl carrier protein